MTEKRREKKVALELLLLAGKMERTQEKGKGEKKRGRLERGEDEGKE